ncbi:MAG TPA: hypothetical protein VJ653_00505 [Acidimicrobiales bacterium]|nr:hypothetical protein [Acidimicrobiales bacterium]
MSNPQQPELARSRTTPAQDQDAVAGVLDGQRDVGADAPRGPVPPENQPGHHPAEEQDKPPLDKFAAKLGTMEPEERKDVLKDEPPSVVNPAPAPAPAAKRSALVGVAALVALIVAVVAGRRIRARR